MSPSGKAMDFDSIIRRFESSHPSFYSFAIIIYMNAYIEFLDEKPESSLPIIKLTKSKNGKTGTAANKQSSNQTTLNPQISQQYAAPPPLPVQGLSMSNYGGGMGGGNMMQQPVQNYNTGAHMAGGATPGMDDMFMEPEAANAALGSSFGSAW